MGIIGTSNTQKKVKKTKKKKQVKTNSRVVFEEALDGMALKTLAEKAGVLPTTLCSFRTGAKKISPDVACKVALALKMEAPHEFILLCMLDSVSVSKETAKVVRKGYFDAKK